MPISTNQDQKIQTKIGIGLIIIITGILTIFGGYQYVALNGELSDTLNHAAKNTTGQLIANLEIPLWNLDPVVVEKIMLAAMAEPSIYAILVKDEQNKIFKGAKRNTEWKIVATTEEISGDFVQQSGDVIKDNAKVGSVQLYLTTKFMTARLLKEIKKIVFTTIVLDIVLFLFLTIMLRKMVIQPVTHLLTIADTIVKGDLSQEVKIEQTDEIGRLANAFNNMKAKISQVLSELDSLLQAVQAGKLTTRGNAEAFAGSWRALVVGVNKVLEAFVAPITTTATALAQLANGEIPARLPQTYNGDFNAIVAALNTMSAKLIQVVQEVKATVRTIVKNSQELSLSAQTLSEGTSQQAAATEEASASMEEISANIRQTADNARQTEALARQAVAYAEESGRVVAETVVAMQQIADQISVIQDIAQQTRLLSLNATIEASRAQDYGKAFGVVAHEVRELADTTRRAAETIATLTDSSLDISQKAGAMLATLVPNIQKTAELVQEISAANAEQATGVEHINRAVQQLDQATQMTAATAEEVATAAEMLAKQAEQLQQSIAFFTLPETLSEPSAADADLLNALQTLAAKGASEHALGALVKSMLAAPAAESSAPEPPSAGPNAPNRKPEIEQPASTPQGHAFEISSTPETARDARDDEFERY